MREAAELPKVPLGPRTLSNLEMISTGVFSPLTGFMDRETTTPSSRTCASRTASPGPCPSPSPSTRRAARELPEDAEIALVDGGRRAVATMRLRDRYRYDREREATLVYRTTDRDHPGVAALYRQGDVLLGGEVDADPTPRPRPLPPPLLHPARAQGDFPREGLAARGRLPDPQPDPSRPRTHPEERARNRGWPAPATPSSARPSRRRHPGRRQDALLRDDPAAATTRGTGPCWRVFPAAMRYAGPQGGRLPRPLPQELRLHPLYRRPRPRGRRQLLRHLRRPAHLRRVRARGTRHHAALLRARLLLPGVLRHGLRPRPAPTTPPHTSLSPTPGCGRCSTAASTPRPSSPGPRWWRSSWMACGGARNDARAGCVNPAFRNPILGGQLPSAVFRFG